MIGGNTLNIGKVVTATELQLLIGINGVVYIVHHILIKIQHRSFCIIKTGLYMKFHLLLLTQM